MIVCCAGRFCKDDNNPNTKGTIVMNHFSKIIRFISIAAILLFFSGCASTLPKVELEVKEKITWSSVETITILPIVDSYQNDNEEKAKTHQFLIDEMESELLFKGYSVEVAKEFTENSELSPDEIFKMDIRKLSKLGPSDKNHILIIFLDKTSKNYNVLVKSFNLDAHAILISKDSQKKLWENKCKVSMTSMDDAPLAGPLTMMVMAATLDLRESGCKRCVHSILSNFPENSDS